MLNGFPFISPTKINRSPNNTLVLINRPPVTAVINEKNKKKRGRKYSVAKVDGEQRPEERWKNRSRLKY